MVRARSAAEMPVVMPWAASMETVKLVPYCAPFFWVIMGQAEFFDHFAVHRQADQAACVFDHEVDGFGGNELGGHQQVRLRFRGLRHR